MTYKEEDEMKRAIANHTYNVKKAKGSEHPVQSRKDINRFRSKRIFMRMRRKKGCDNSKQERKKNLRDG